MHGRGHSSAESDYMGSHAAACPSGNEFVGWGSQPYFSEYTAQPGRLMLDGRPPNGSDI